MSILAEGLTSLLGLMRLFCLDPSGLQFLRATPDGFLRSFWAAAVVSPSYILLRTDLEDPELQAVGVPLYLVGQLLTSIILWGAIPLAMWYVTEAIDRRERFYVYATAYNWGQILILAINLPFLIVLATGTTGTGAALLEILTLVGSLGLLGLIYFYGLRITALGALGLVVLDVMLSYLITGLTSTMYS